MYICMKRSYVCIFVVITDDHRVKRKLPPGNLYQFVKAFCFAYNSMYLCGESNRRDFCDHLLKFTISIGPMHA